MYEQSRSNPKINCFLPVQSNSQGGIIAQSASRITDHSRTYEPIVQTERAPGCI